MDDTLQFQRTRLEQISQELISINESINFFKMSLKDISEKVISLEELKDLEKRVHEFIDANSQSHASLKRRADLSEVSSRVMQANNSEMINSISSLHSKYNGIESDLQDHKKTQDLKLQVVEQNHKKAIDFVKRECEASLQNLQRDLVVSPSDILQQNNDVMRKLESAALDGTNAVMKVNNIDLNMRILEKKIENLAIQIKRIELSKAG